MRVHKLKTVQPYFDDVFYRKKSFELRKNDRDYKIGDRLDLFEGTDEITDKTDISKRWHCHVWVTYILEGGKYGLEEGYCILGITHKDPSIEE